MGKSIPVMARKHLDSPNNFVLFIRDDFLAQRESIE